MEKKTIVVYGSPEPTKEEKEKMMQRLFKYLHAKINAELLNPDSDDYDRVREIELLEEIATADLHPWLRKQLVDLLNSGNKSYDE